MVMWERSCFLYYATAPELLRRCDECTECCFACDWSCGLLTFLLAIPCKKGRLQWRQADAPTISDAAY